MRTALSFLLLLLAAALPGCGTLAGLAIGLGIDASQPDSMTLLRSSLAKVAPGTEARLHLVDGTVEDVIVGRPDLEPLDAYAAAVDDRQLDAEHRIPTPPAAIRLRLDRSIHPHARLEGYDLDGCWIALDTLRSAAYLPWTRIAEVAIVGGGVWTGDSLRRRCAELGIPSRSGRWFRRSGSAASSTGTFAADEREFIRTSDIEQLVVTPASNAVWWGMAAGLTADIVIVAVAARSMSFGLNTAGKW